MAIQSGNQGGIFATINITPLTDIFLVLLIIFMVATAVTIESAAHVDLPRLAAPSENQPHGVTVTYTSNHQIYVNQKPVSERELADAVKQALAASPLKLVVFDGDPKVILGDAVRIIGIAKESGAAQISLAVEHAAGPPSPAETTPEVSVPQPEEVAPGGGPAPEPVAPSGGP
ncbi:MAG TPA: biopolymer transporter ExbD [Candidatus Binataceae bacterium]|nr:biopolymer transporter ExbD [Candidatus Binataceae bacterium]